MRGKQITKRSRKILAGTIRTKYLDAFAELSMNHLCELAIDREHIRTRTHKIKPSVSREIINKTDIVKNPPREDNGAGPQMSVCIRSKDVVKMDSLKEKGRA